MNHWMIEKVDDDYQVWDGESCRRNRRNWLDESFGSADRAPNHRKEESSVNGNSDQKLVVVDVGKEDVASKNLKNLVSKFT